MLLLLVFAISLHFIPRTQRLKVALPVQTAVLMPARLATAFLYKLSTNSAENRHLSQLAAELAVENARLRGITGHRTSLPSKSLSLKLANVIARDLRSFGHWLVLDLGTAQGISPGCPVLTPEGVVGVVTDASRHQSLVQTLLNPELRIAVIDTRTRMPAMARIDRNELLDLNYIPVGSDIAVGDTLVTAGLGTVFPKGLKVGTVLRVGTDPNGLFLPVTARPFVDVRRLEQVFVLLIPDSVPPSDSSGWLTNLATPELRPPLSEDVPPEGK